MSKYVNTDRYIAINGTAISDHCASADLTDNTDKIDVTAFSSAAYRQYAPGLADAGVVAEVYADFDAAAVHAILQPLYANRYNSAGTFVLEMRPTSAAVSATNPRGSMIARLYGYSPFSGKVGDAAMFSCEFANAGTAGWTWGTA